MTRSQESLVGTQQSREELKEVREQNVEKQKESIQQAQRGTEERLKQPSLADPSYQQSEQRIAIIEAELLGTKALGGDLKRSNQESANKLSSSYLGPIVAESEQYSIQKVNSVQTVRHAKADLPRVPQVGDNVRINYAANVASVKEEQKLDRSHKHKLSL